MDTEINVIEEQKLMMSKLSAILNLAGITVKETHQLPNGYCDDQCCIHRPWALFITEMGSIKIGWRKRVINIEWSKELGIHGRALQPESEAWITSFDNGVHAYGYAKAVEYLSNLRDIYQHNNYLKTKEISNGISSSNPKR